VDPREFLRLAVDPLRLSLLGRAAEGTVDVAEVANRHGVPERTVLAALGRLRFAGLVDDDLRLDVTVVRALAADLPKSPPADPGMLGAGWSSAEGEILSRFFSGDRLSAIPSARGKRMVVLERLAQEFEPGLRYDEPEVNFRLQMVHPDYASLRRHLVDEEFLTRADGVCWRTGGRYGPDLDPPDAPGSDHGRPPEPEVPGVSP
jgi:hypothetical protein